MVLPLLMTWMLASLRLFEIALVLVRLDHVASRIVNANHGAMRSSLAHLRKRRHVVLRCFQDGFLGHVHKYLFFLVTDPVDMLR